MFTSNHTGYNDLYLADFDTDKLTNLTSSDSNNERGDISPNGEWVVFSSDRYEAGNQDLVLMNLETRQLERLTNNPTNELIARWSKDSQTIYYGALVGQNWELYSMDVFSKSSTRLTYSPGFDGDPRIWRGW